MVRKAMAVALAAGLVMGAGACDEDEVAPEAGDIVEVARAAGTFETLLAAVEAAGLTSTLRGAGPFTVFAPTDEAFAKLPAGTVEALLQDIPTLTSILTYHVVPDRVEASEVVSLTDAPTVNGARLSISVSGGTVYVDGARVVQTDVEARNGVIHVIDSVILPPSS